MTGLFTSQEKKKVVHVNHSLVILLLFSNVYREASGTFPDHNGVHYVG